MATVAVTTAVWVAATFLTAPTDAATLERFYRVARPAGPGWTDVRLRCGGLSSSDDLASAFTGTVAGCAFVYAALFGVGHLLMGHSASAAVSLVVLIVSGVVLRRVVARLWSS
jgi:hypothetical protein